MQHSLLYVVVRPSKASERRTNQRASFISGRAVTSELLMRAESASQERRST